MRFPLTLLLTLCSLLVSASSLWRAYPSYAQPTEIERGGNTLYVLASSHLYAYNTTDQSIATYDRTRQLSGCTISHIAWCGKAARLVIAYDDQNIDLLSANGEVHNLPDYAIKGMTDDKTVYAVCAEGSQAWLCTGFGLVRIDVGQALITDTYRLGMKTDHAYTEGGYIYAEAPGRGLYRAALNGNPADKKTWERVGNYTDQRKKTDPELLATVSTLKPGGPLYDYFGYMRFYNGKLYTVGRGYNVIKSLNRPGCIQILQSDDDWTLMGENLTSQPERKYFNNLHCIAIDPRDERHIFTGGKCGLFEFRENNLYKHYTLDNSLLHSAINNDPNYVLVQGMTFDTAGHLWLVNSSNNTENLIEITPDGQWISHHKEALEGLPNVDAVLMDSRGLIWMGNNSWVRPSLHCYQPSTDALVSYTTFINQDGTPVEHYGVAALAEDKEGNLWVGTTAGLLMVSARDVGKEDIDFIQVKIPRNDGTSLADYLLAGVDITAIAIDGGGRKWIGTASSGLYLISADNMTEEQHFLQSNSPLLSDNIESLAIDDRTGEVYIGTDKGLCSYRSNATAPAEEMSKESVYAYPNPVRPDYTGPVTIVGLAYDAHIIITSANGALVHEGRSNGGSYQWDGCDRQGSHVASGVYMVQTATSDGSKGTVCKVIVVR